MILAHKHDLKAFREAVRKWIKQTVPVDWREKSGKDYPGFQRWWMDQLSRAGIATPHWPVEYGGADLSLWRQVVIADEMARADAPDQKMYTVSLNQIPATLLAWGSKRQKDRYLPGVSAGDVWRQGFSEPGAGSDLASLRTRAVRESDEYIVNGQKVWSSFSMYAEYCILLARTDPNVKKHAGISFFIMDMQVPGVEVRPIRQINGQSEFAELFLTDVRIPVTDRIGEEGQGWQVAQSTLASERGVLGYSMAEQLRFGVEAFYGKAVEADAAWLKDDQLRREFMHLFGQMQALRRMIRQLLQESAHSHDASYVMPAYVKLVLSELRQKFAALRLRITGIGGQRTLEGPPGDGQIEESSLFDYISSYDFTISAGTNEIMRNIIAERGLGMPR